MYPRSTIHRTLFRELSLYRCYSDQPKASIKLIAEIRKRIAGTSLTKAREALAATNNNLEDALKWLEKDLAISGAAKAAKLEGRTASQGLIALAILSNGGWDKGRSSGARAAMVELNCETDFVARNELFVQLARDISHTAAFLTEPSAETSDTLFSHASVDMLVDAPVVCASPSSSSKMSISEAIQSNIAKLGEKISLRRACTLVTNPVPDNSPGLFLSSYVHGGVSSPAAPRTQAGSLGTLAALALRSRKLSALVQGPEGDMFQGDVANLGRSLAMQISGLDTRSVGETSAFRETGDGDSTALYKQPFLMQLGAPTDESVQKVLMDWGKEKGLVDTVAEVDMQEGIRVVHFEKWTVGQPLDGESS